MRIAASWSLGRSATLKNRDNMASRTVNSNKMAKIKIMMIQKIFVSNEFALVEIFEVADMPYTVGHIQINIKIGSSLLKTGCD